MKNNEKNTCKTENETQMVLSKSPLSELGLNDFGKLLAMRTVSSIDEKTFSRDEEVGLNVLKKIDLVIADYIESKYTPTDLYVIHFSCSNIFMKNGSDSDLHNESIEFIRSQESLPEDYRKALVDNVRYTHPKLFGLLVEFIDRYRLPDSEYDWDRFIEKNFRQ